MSVPSQRQAQAIGTRLHQQRLRLGLSQRDLAEPGVSYAYISRIENGQRMPSVKALRKLAPKLGVSVDWLETGKENRCVELARLVLASDGQPLPARARNLAGQVLNA
jgi:transcriptional regulator with XRE-family HTH domain